MAGRSLDYMMSIYRRAGSLLSSAYASGVEASSGAGRLASGAAACGMGSSGIAAEIVGAVLDRLGSPEPLRVYKSWRMPSWEPGESLVLAISYSGTTWETLKCVEDALGRGAPAVAAVTSGGSLASLVESAGGVVARIEGGLPQRTGLPAMVGGALGLAGLWSSVPRRAVDSEVSNAAEALGAGEPSWLGEIASEIAASDLVVVAACGFLGIAAHRWRTELAENAKMPAKAEVYPESGHNDLVAYQAKPTARTLFIILEGGEAPCTELMKAVAEIYEAVGRVVKVPLPPGTLAPLLRAAQLAGMASALAAVERGLDPLATPILEKYRSWRAGSPS